jgi:thioredoxin-related protein
MFSLPGCPWCDALRTEHLNGLAAQQEALRIRFIELNLSERRPFADGAPPQQPNTTGTRFWWQASSPADCARNLQVRMAPTVLFMGPEGEIAERLVGYGSPDFYGAYLEQRIAQAHASIRQTNRP